MIYLVFACERYEGDYFQFALSEEGLDRFLATRPAYVKNCEDEGYSTWQSGDSSWWDIRPVTVDNIPPD